MSFFMITSVYAHNMSYDVKKEKVQEAISSLKDNLSYHQIEIGFTTSSLFPFDNNDLTADIDLNHLEVRFAKDNNDYILECQLITGEAPLSRNIAQYFLILEKCELENTTQNSEKNINFKMVKWQDTIY